MAKMFMREFRSDGFNKLRYLNPCAAKENAVMIFLVKLISFDLSSLDKRAVERAVSLPGWTNADDSRPFIFTSASVSPKDILGLIFRFKKPLNELLNLDIIEPITESLLAA